MRQEDCRSRAVTGLPLPSRWEEGSGVGRFGTPLIDDAPPSEIEEAPRREPWGLNYCASSLFRAFLIFAHVLQDLVSVPIFVRDLPT